jgi:hypothetical protein
VASMPPPGPPQPPSAPPSGPYPSAAPGYAPAYAGAGPAYEVRKRTGWLLLAQILAIVEGIAILLFGVLVILAGIVARSQIQDALNNVQGTSSVDVTRFANVATGIVVGVGVFLVVYFAFFIWAAVISGRPSTGGRVVVVILDIIMVLFSLAAFTNRGHVSAGAYLLGFGVFWAWQALILFGMAIHGTRRLNPATAPR